MSSFADDSMSDEVFEESDIETTKSQTCGKKALNVSDLVNDERTASPTGYPGYKPPKEALRMYALENDYFQENNERQNVPDDDLDGWKSYTIEDNDFDESIVHKVVVYTKHFFLMASYVADKYIYVNRCLISDNSTWR